MGKRDRVGLGDQRGEFLSHGFALIDVQAGRVDAPVAQGPQQGVLVHDTTARGADKGGGGLHGRQFGGADEVTRLRGERDVQRDHVGLGEQRGQVHRCGEGVVGRVRVVVDDPHPEALGAARHGSSDLAVADQAERGAVHVQAQVVVHPEQAPLTGGQRVAGGAEAPAGHQDEREGEVGGGLGENSGGVGDHDSAFGGGVPVDRVVAHARQRDDLQRGSGRVQQGGVHPVVAEGQDGARALRQFCQIPRLGLARPRPRHDLRVGRQAGDSPAGEGGPGGEHTLLHLFLPCLIRVSRNQ